MNIIIIIDIIWDKLSEISILKFFKEIFNVFKCISKDL